jgi:hypothetical protein
MLSYIIGAVPDDRIDDLQRLTLRAGRRSIAPPAIQQLDFDKHVRLHRYAEKNSKGVVRKSFYMLMVPRGEFLKKKANWCLTKCQCS